MSMPTVHVLPVFPVAETRFGKMYTLRGDFVIGRSLRLYGEFSGDEVDSILSLVRPGDHALDIGANIGFHSLALARAVGPEGHVTAIEPQRFCFQLLCANMIANQLTTVHCLRAAAGAASGTCEVPCLDPSSPHNAGGTSVSLTGTGTQNMDKVPLITVDSLTLDRCNFIKIDTEGFEVEVVLGATATLARCLPVLYVEVHDQDKLRDLIAALGPFGYRLVLHHTQFYRAGNPMQEPLQMFNPGAGGRALIALPPGRTLSRGLPGKVQLLN
jgi:FkbM family methyltransferase